MHCQPQKFENLVNRNEIAKRMMESVVLAAILYSAYHYCREMLFKILFYFEFFWQIDGMDLIVLLSKRIYWKLMERQIDL